MKNQVKMEFRLIKMINNSDIQIESHLNNRIAFISILAGFLLNILFQIVIMDKNHLDQCQKILLDFLFISLLFIIFCFVFSFVMILMASSKIYSKNQKVYKKYIAKSLAYGRRISLIGIYGFTLLIYYFIRLYFYHYSQIKIFIVIFAFSVNILYIFLLMYCYFYLSNKWTPKSKQVEIEFVRKSKLKRNLKRYFIFTILIEFIIIFSIFIEIVVCSE